MAAPAFGSPGCCCDAGTGPCVAYLCVRVRGCAYGVGAYTDLSTAAVVVVTGPGGVVYACGDPVPAGVYSIAASSPGYISRTFSYTIPSPPCSGTQNKTYVPVVHLIPTSISVNVRGCTAPNGLAGATVTLTAGSASGSCTTDASGNATMAISGTMEPGDTLTITTARDRYATYVSSGVPVPALPDYLGATLPCRVYHHVDPDADHFCCRDCDVPACYDVTVSTPWGAVNIGRKADGTFQGSATIVATVAGSDWLVGPYRCVAECQVGGFVPHPVSVTFHILYSNCGGIQVQYLSCAPSSACAAVAVSDPPCVYPPGAVGLATCTGAVTLSCPPGVLSTTVIRGSRYCDGTYTVTENCGPPRMAQAPRMAPAPSGPPPLAPAPRPARGAVRVGLLAPVLAQGGAEAHMLSLARTVDPALASWRGCVVTSDHVDPAMLAAMAGHMPVALGRENARALAADCDVLITWAIPDLPRILEGLPRPPKVVSVVHAPADSPWGQSAYAEAGGIDRWVAVSELAMEAIPAASLAAAPAATIWNAVDAARMEVARPREEMRRAWGVPEGARVAGYLGRLSSEKRPEVMADLARLLPGPWHVVVVGAGFERAAMEARSAGLARFHMPGPDGHAGDVLNAFDTLVVPSEYESFCLTMAEGFWAGVPVVATPVGLAKLAPGLAREVPAMATGADIAAAILADAADTSHARDRIAHARRFARERLSPERFGREWTDFLAEVACPGHHIADAGKMIADHVADPDKMVANPHMARLALVRACPERGEAVGCACNGLNVCGAGKGATPGTTTIAECLDCVAGPPDG